MSDFYRGKRVLVTGGTGLIGVPLVKKLIELGAEVNVVSMDNKERAQQVLPVGAKFYQLDLTDYCWCSFACRLFPGDSPADMVFHLAGVKGSVSLGRSKPASFFTSMLQFNTNMMEAAYKSGVERYLYTSSVGVYPEASIFREDEAWNGPPFSVDQFPGWAKRMGELQAEAYKIEYGWDKIAIVRPCNVFGPYDRFDEETSMVVSALITRVNNTKMGDKVKVWGDGSAIRDFIFSEDVADGMLLAMEKGANCTPINLGSGRGYSIRELVEAVAEAYDIPMSTFEFDTSKPSGESIRLMDVQRAKDMIGFEAKTSLKEGVKKTVDWYLNNMTIASSSFDAFKKGRAV